MSNSLPSLMTKEQQELLALFHKRIALLLTKTNILLKKTYEQIPNPDCSTSITAIVISA